MDGLALSWFQWMFRNDFITSWATFLQKLESCFAPTFYDDPKGALFKFTQKGSINEYLTEFVRLANRIISLPSAFLLSCFISGLVPEIQREVQALQPISLPQATSLAKLLKDMFEDRCRSYHTKTPHHNPLPTIRNTIPHSPTPLSALPPLQKNLLQKLTHEEMVVKHEKGLCYSCDAKWNTSHHCRARFFLFIADEDDTTCETPFSPPFLDPELPPPIPYLPNNSQAQINKYSQQPIIQQC